MMFSAFVSSGCHQMQMKAEKFHFSSYNAKNNLQILLFSPPEIIIDSTSSVYPKKIFRRKQHVERRTDFNCFLNGFSKKRKKGENVSFFSVLIFIFLLLFLQHPKQPWRHQAHQQRTQERRRTDFSGTKKQHFCLEFSHLLVSSDDIFTTKPDWPQQ